MDQHGHDIVDPGWRIGWKDLVGFVFPPLLAARLATGGDPREGSYPPIRPLRMAYVTFTTSLVLFWVVLAALFPFWADVDLPWYVWGLLGIGLVSPAAGLWYRRYEIECGDLGEMAQRYASTMFRAVAFTMAAPLYGFVASFLVEAYWPYLVGLVIGLAGHMMAAPTADDVRRRDERLSRRGCTASLREALYTTRSE